MKIPLNQLEDDCLNSALLAAVENGSANNAAKLILRGATNVDEALAKSRMLRQYVVTAMLLIVKAAIENDSILILKLYGENVKGQESKISLTKDDDLVQIQAAICNNVIRTIVPIEISRRNDASDVREELLLRTDVDRQSGAVLWFGLRLTQLEISWLRKIYWVKKLRLAKNDFTSLPMDMGNYLKQCIKLDLQWNKLNEIPSCLLELPCLNELNISHNNLVNIPDVPEWSASLSVLDLSYNYLSNLPGSAVACALKNLNISNNQFCIVPQCVCSFISLTTLNIANNSKIVALPPQLGKLKNLLSLNLDGLNNLNNPPKSVCITTADYLRYLTSQLCNARSYYHMKMMVVGRHAMGKSTLVARLHNREICNDPTVGIDISEWSYAPAVSKKTFHFSIWDFSGREEYYATHQCFLSQHSLYLLVWKVTEGDAGVADLRPWLNNISLRAPNSCVIIVGTFLDKIFVEERQSGKINNLLLQLEELTKQYCHLTVSNIIMVGLKGCIENVEKLKDCIYNAASEYKVNDQHIMGQLIPSSYHALDAILCRIHRLVKEGKHKPIMHAAQFKKMIQDLHLVDIQDDDDELHMVTCFLHQIGSLLHYDDHKHNLDDLYFVDPCWLCDLVSRIFTMEIQKAYVKQGILESKNIPLLFKDKRFPLKYFHQYLALLSRFEIALPLDMDCKRILIPSMFPKKHPDMIQQQPDCYKRIILFCPLFYEGQSLRCSTPPGLWSRLLCRIMNTVKEVRNILSEHVLEDNMVTSSDVSILGPSDTVDQITENSMYSVISEESIATSTYSNVLEGPLECDIASEVSSVYSDVFERPLENSFASEISSTYSNAFEGPIESALPSLSISEFESLLTCRPQPSQNESDGGPIEIMPNTGDGSLIYWSTGLVYKENKFTFSIESLAENIKCHDKDGILILASQGSEGRKILGKLIDIVEEIISEWYPGLNSRLEQRVACPECLKTGNPNPYEFIVEQLFPLIADQKLTQKCSANHEVQLMKIVPDLLLADLDPAFLLDFKELDYTKEKESLLGTGAFGEIYRGRYKNQAVAIKFYASADNSSIDEKNFKELRSESKIMLQLHHPCLVCMVGVTIVPTMSLVLEEAPEGPLQYPLIKEHRAISRIILYRIAIQVASALRFLHSINIIFRYLTAENVLLWSLSLDHFINCKLTDFNIAAHSKPREISLHSTKGFVAPEISHINHAKEQSVYDHHADIFSLGMFLYQIVARRHPFHNLHPLKIEAAIEEGIRPQLEDVPIAEIGLYYMTRVMKFCWAGSSKERPTSQQIVEWFSASALQFIISVVPFNHEYSVRHGCIVTPDVSNEFGSTPTSSELWICCDGVGGGELTILTTNTMEENCRHSVKENQIRCVKQCGQYVWVPSRTDLEYGVVHIFDKNTKDLVHTIEMKENAVSCITSSDDLVYLGTMEGSCFVLPIDVADVRAITKPHYVYVSEYCVDGLAVSQTSLWVSIRNYIILLNPKTLVLESVEKRTKNVHAYIGKMMLSDNRNVMWSAHLKGVILSAWNAYECTHITDVDVSVCAEEKCHIGDPQDMIMTAMCTALDTVWIGLSSGYIMVFGMSPPGELLTYFRPYNSFIRFLSACKYPGPCQKEECMMLCGGKLYRPDSSFVELPDYTREDEKGIAVDTSGVVVLWEVLTAKYIRQAHYLSSGTSWLNYSTLEKAMNDTGFTDSM